MIVRYYRLIPLLLRLILVAPTPHLMTTVARSFHAFPYHVLGHALQIVGPTDSREEVDEGRRKVETIIAKLGCLVIPRENMMVIVPTLAEGEYRNTFVLRRIDVSVSNEKETLVEYQSCRFRNKVLHK